MADHRTVQTEEKTFQLLPLFPRPTPYDSSLGLMVVVVEVGKFASSAEVKTEEEAFGPHPTALKMGRFDKKILPAKWKKYN